MFHSSAVCYHDLNILFGLVGFIFGNVIAGITVYVIMKYDVFNCSDNSLQNSTLKEGKF
jgi:ABC-type enterochelin transport system permease subunit